MAAVACIAAHPGRVAGDDGALRHVARDDGPRAHQRHPPHLDPGQDHRPAANRSAGADQALAHHPVGVRLRRPVRIDRARMLVVEQHHAGTEEHTSLEREAVKNVHAVLQLAEIADADILVDVCAFAENALAADFRAFAHLSLVPDLRPRTDPRLVDTNSRRGPSNASTLFARTSSRSAPARPSTGPSTRAPCERIAPAISPLLSGGASTIITSP